jgi:hypothetical protein
MISNQLDMAVRGKLVAENVDSLDEPTLHRVFDTVACPELCLKSARRQIAEGLTLEKLYTEFPVATF